MEAWPLVVRAGGYCRLHVHPGWTLSGVYYIDAGDVLGDRPDSGLLEFVDPRPAAENDRIGWLVGVCEPVEFWNPAAVPRQSAARCDLCGIGRGAHDIGFPRLQSGVLEVPLARAAAAAKH